MFICRGGEVRESLKVQFCMNSQNMTELSWPGCNGATIGMQMQSGSGY